MSERNSASKAEVKGAGGIGRAPEGPSFRAIRRWILDHRVELLFALGILALLPLRGYWAPDEPDFAQCVKEMRATGAWLLPSLNGAPYTEKPILFYWLMRISALVLEPLSGGAGFQRGIAAWALRVPSAAAAILFLFALRRWADRFLDRDAGPLAALVLATAPLWIWQAEFIQIDLVFSALLAWSWLCWLSGYLLMRGEDPAGPGEARGQFLRAWGWLGLAVLAKGPLALVLTAALLLAFLLWQRDLRALGRMHPAAGAGLLALVVLPWYLAAAWKGGASYAYAMVVHQNLDRALHAWDHVQPWWRYGSYLLVDFLPWSLLLPMALLGLRRQAFFRLERGRFLLLAFLVPFVLLSCSRSKQGKYLLMAYPFLALLAGQWAAMLLRRDDREGLRRASRLLGGFLAILALALGTVAFLHGGGHRLQAQAAPFLGPLRLCAAVMALGSALAMARPRQVFRIAGATLGAGLLVVAGAASLRLDPQKDYREWARCTEGEMAGRQAWFWGNIRSGAMIYSDRFLPELASRESLASVAPGQLVVAPVRRWTPGFQGLRPEDLESFEVLHRRVQGSDGLLLLRRRGGSERAGGSEPTSGIKGFRAAPGEGRPVSGE